MHTANINCLILYKKKFNINIPVLVWYLPTFSETKSELMVIFCLFLSRSWPKLHHLISNFTATVLLSARLWFIAAFAIEESHPGLYSLYNEYTKFFLLMWDCFNIKILCITNSFRRQGHVVFYCAQVGIVLNQTLYTLETKSDKRGEKLLGHSSLWVRCKVPL